MTKSYCYVLLDVLKPGNYQYGDFCFSFMPLYVGKGNRKDRAKTHINTAKKIKKLSKRNNTYKNIRLIEMLNENVEPEIVYYEFQHEEQSFSFEKKLIKTIGRKDLGYGPLANLTDGGDGISNVTEETRKKMSEAQKRTKKNIDGLMRYVKSRTPEELSEIGKRAASGVKPESRIGRVVSEETRKKLSLAAKGRCFSEEHKQKIRKAKTGNPLSEETKLKISETKKSKSKK